MSKAVFAAFLPAAYGEDDRGWRAVVFEPTEKASRFGEQTGVFRLVRIASWGMLPPWPPGHMAFASLFSGGPQHEGLARWVPIDVEGSAIEGAREYVSPHESDEMALARVLGREAGAIFRERERYFEASRGVRPMEPWGRL